MMNNANNCIRVPTYICNSAISIEFIHINFVSIKIFKSISDLSDTKELYIH